MTRIAIIGHASLDHVARLDGVPSAGRTTTILDRPDDGWPRLGGSPAYVAAALVAAGIGDAFPISWIGNDPAGMDYRAQLRQKWISDTGLAVVEGARTPVALLAYQPDGGCICLYDPGAASEFKLSTPQRKLIASSEWVCLTVGPKAATEEALAAIGPRAGLAWVVKHDPRSMPTPLAARVAARADLILCSQAERAFLDEAIDATERLSPASIVIETRGPTGAVFKRHGDEFFVGTSPIDVDDPTGAGDTFAGGVLAAIVSGEDDPENILKAGHNAARALLATRRVVEKESVRE